MNIYKLFVPVLALSLLVPTAAAAPLAGHCTAGAAYDPACDVDHDGDIDIFDIQLAAGHWNQTGTYVGDNNHTHLGQNWTGSDNPLVLTGSYGDPDYAPLVLTNTTGDGLSIPSAADHGVHVGSTGLNGVSVGSAGGNGLSVGSAGSSGVYVFRAGSPSTQVVSPLSNGFEVEGAQGHGLFVGRADYHGVFVNSAGSVGVAVHSAASDGVSVGSTGQNGVLVNSAGSDGVRVNTAVATGMSVHNAGGHGVYVNAAGGDGVWVNSAGDDGVHVSSAVADGVSVYNAGGHGLYVNSAGYAGVGIDWAGNTGVSVVAAGNMGVYANTTQASGQWGFYTPDRIYGSIGMFSAVSLVAQASGPDSLNPGDLVAVAGRADPLPGSTAPLPLVRLADDSFTAVIGVVESRLVLTPQSSQPANPGQAPVEPEASVLRNADGPAQAGDYVSITVLGVTQVKVDSTAVIDAGQALTVSSRPGRARALRTVQVEGVTLSEGRPTLGVTLEAAKDGLVWVMVNP